MLETKWFESLLLAAIALAGAGCDVECLSARCIGTGGTGGAETGGTGGTGGDQSGGSGGAGGGACAVVLTEPTPGEPTFPVNGELRIEWTVPVLPGSLAAGVALTDQGGQVVPASVTLEDDDTTAVVVPDQSLHIWSDYTLAAGSEVTSAAGDSCGAVSVPFTTGGPVLEPRGLLPAALDGVTVLDGKVYGVAPRYRGLQIYDLDPGPIALTADLRTTRSPRALVPAEGELAFAPGGYDGLLRFRLDTTAPPDDLDTPGFVSDAAPFVRSGAWYVATAGGPAGLHLVSTGGAAGLTPMVDLGPIAAVTGPVATVDASPDGTLIVVGRGDAVSILTSTTPAEPASFTLVAELVVTNLDVRLDGDRLFVASGGQGLSYYDLSVLPATPPLVSTACAGCAGVSGLFTSGGDVFARTGPREAARFTIDASGALQLADTYAARSPVSAVTASDTQAFLATEEGLVVFARGAAAALPVWESPTGFGLAQDSIRVGEHVYVASGALGLLTFHWPLGGSAVRVDQDLSPGTALDYAAAALAVVGDPPARLVLGDGRGGVTTYDLADPANPAALGSTPTADIAGRIAISGDLAYVCNSNQGVLVVDVSAGATVVGTLPSADPTDACADLAISGNLLLITGGAVTKGHFRVADLTIPESPELLQVGYFPEVQAFQSMALANGQIFVTTRKTDPGGHNGAVRRLAIMSAGADAPPTLDWMSDDLAAIDLTVLGDYLFVSAEDLGIQVFDLKPGDLPLFHATVPTPGDAFDVRPDGDGILVTERQGGVDRFATGTF